MRMRHFLLAGTIPLIFAVVATSAQSPTRTPDIEEIMQWARSGHADAHSESFAHWNDEGEIPPVCSTCHSGAGFRSLHGLDGSEPGLPQSPIPVGGVVDCDTCHSPGLQTVTHVTLPSGQQHPVTGFEAACMTCHSGRAASVTVERAVAERPEDVVDAELRFINPHYATAAASLLGGTGALGYHYPGRTYEPRFVHARPVSTCISCHEPHNLTVSQETCLTCHETGESHDIRISRQSHDGSGNLEQGIAVDIAANRKRLFTLMADYAREVVGTPIVFDAAHHPYFFADHNGDGLADQNDGAPVAYANWTPRLLKAAYNWKFVGADAAIHVHNPHYALELLYDSAVDLSGALEIELTGMAR